MYQPELFIKYGVQAKTDAAYVLHRYPEILKLNGCSKFMDVGCGPGNLTHDLLYPMLPETTEQLVGIDVSPQMVNYAKQNYGNSKLLFEEMDITTHYIPQQFEQSFDCIFSFYCIHLLKDQRQALLNMHKMLTPGGKIFLSLVGKSFYYDMYSWLFEKSKWHHIVKNYKDTQPISATCESAASYFETLLDDVGFQVYFCVEKEKVFVYNVDTFTNTMLAILNFKIPENLKGEFLSANVEYMREQKCVKIDECGNELIHAPYTLLSVYAIKI